MLPCGQLVLGGGLRLRGRRLLRVVLVLDGVLVLRRLLLLNSQLP